MSTTAIDLRAQEIRDVVFRKYRFIDRKWDFMFWFTAAFVVGAAANITHLLFAGDWDFWTDWKDRQWWMTVTPFATIIIPSALQYIQWRAWRFPTGAVYTACCLFVCTWVGRILQWKYFVNYPLNFVWPQLWIPAGILIDWLLLETRSFIITSLLGGGLWTIAFWMTNYTMMAPFYQPATFMGHILTIADIQGIGYIRAQTPEYLRIIERGSLRTFLQETQYVSLAFGSTMAAIGYWIGQFIGRYLSVWPILRYLKQV
jgi:methane/ammonia monooxygenase subunit A